MKLDFSTVEDAESYISIPEGTYVCRIADVRESVTRDGSARWALRLEVLDGEYAGRTAAWDALIFSERGMPRVKHVLAMLGFDVSGSLDIESEHLKGLQVRAQCLIEEYEDRLTGKRQRRLRVPYSGYESASGNGHR
jgi:hypothetical protein